MTRKKVKLVWIVNDTARKASLKKRRVGLFKKVNELTVLCGVNAFVVIYSPDDNEPAVWPSREAAEELFMRFQGLSEMEQSKKMMNQESYLKERMAKTQEQIKKHQKSNREMEMTYLMHQLYQGKGIDEFEMTELQGLVWLVGEKMKEIRKRIDYFQHVPPLSENGPFPSAEVEEEDVIDCAHDASISAGVGATAGNGDGDGRNHVHPLGWDQWFIEMMNNNNNDHGGSSIIKSEMGLARPWNNIGGGGGGGGSYIGGGINMGLHQGNIGGGGALGFGQLPHHQQLNDMGAGIGLSLPYGTGNANAMGGFFLDLPHGSGNVNIMGLGLPQYPQYHHGNIGASNGLVMPPPLGHTGSGSIGGGDGGGGSDHMGLLPLPPRSGFFGGASDPSMPYDVTKNWPHNFNP